MKPKAEAFDDLFELPLFDQSDRDFLKSLREKLSKAKEIPVSGLGNDALVAWVRRLGEWGIFEGIYADSLAGISLKRVCLARETLAEFDILADLALIMQFLGGIPLLSGDSEPVKAASSKIRRGEAVAAFAITEPEAGSDLSRIKTSATLKEGFFYIKGCKRLITNVGVADFYTLFARIEGIEGAEGKIGAFLLPANAQGVKPIVTPPMVPHPIGRLEFDNVRLPADHLIGEASKGMKIALQTLGFCRPTVGAAACGMAKRAILEAIAHTSSRKAFGGVLSDQQLVKAGLSKSIAELDASRLLVYRAAWARDNAPNARHDRAGSTAKWQATEKAQGIIDTCMQLSGGIATLEGHKLSELYRALRPLRIYEGASEIHQMLVFDAFMAEMG